MLICNEAEDGGGPELGGTSIVYKNRRFLLLSRSRTDLVTYKYIMMNKGQ
jgi:hypothetical protein